MRLKHIALLLTLFIATPATPQQKQEPFTLKTTTEVVLVNVTVRDKDGAFVRDLKPEDFTILEDGKPQKILSIDVENTDAVVENGTQVPNLLSNIGAAPAAAAAATAQAAVPKEMFRDRRLLVLFFDLSSMQPEEIVRAA